MIDEVKKHLDANFSFLKGKKILLGVSAGVDSMTLLHLFHNLSYDISLAHVNFKLRAENSDLDEKLVAETAEKLNLELFIKSFETIKYSKDNKVSIEMAARDLRYNWFYSLAEKHSFDYIVVAHHLNDNVETVLQNLSRGTGINGITGMKAVTGKLIRPLLAFKRSQIVDYALDNDIVWREDLSNLDTRYRRNKIRHLLIPVFEELNPSFIESIARSIKNFEQSEEIQQKYIEENEAKFWKEQNDRIVIDINSLKKLAGYKLLLWEKLKNYGFESIDDILNSFESISGKVFFSNTHRVVKDREFFFLSKKEEESTEVFEINTGINSISESLKIHVEFAENISASKNEACLDADKITLPLKLRKKKEGDIFHPVGLKGKKKLSKYFKDEKYSLLDKEQQWLLCNGDNIAWLVGKRVDRRFAASSKSKNIIKISII